MWTFRHQLSWGQRWPLGEDTGEDEAHSTLLNPLSYEDGSVTARDLALQRKRHFNEGCGAVVKISPGQPGSQRMAWPTLSSWAGASSRRPWDHPVSSCRTKLDSLSQESIQSYVERLIWRLTLLKMCSSAMSDSLWPHGLQHARLPCPSPTPRACSTSWSLSQWCHPTISSSVVPFSSCPQSLPASGSFPMSQLFARGGQSIGVSAAASVLPVNIQDWIS